MNAEAQLAVVARGLRKSYGEGVSAVAALDGVSVSVPSGKFIAIMGPSGSGKSTLMQALAGLDSVDEGNIWIDGTEITTMRDAALTRLRRDRVGFVFQSFNLIATLTAEQNILLPLNLARRRVDKEWMKQIVGALGISERLTHKPHELSGGQQQRVAIVRALITKPAVVFADEPTGNLDSSSGAEVLRILRDSVDRFGQTVIMVTHDPGAAAHADEVVVLADGKVRGHIASPTVDSVIDALRRLETPKAEAAS
ncbi:ABC transporter ATP-binding protein [Lysinibacter sp. HNR]|uniref:ABC transporter ATP-binding protein n=1 Tax=Lysinibacter sp. HNR TaxID=3031408 RepID=UPI002435A892|nr:ABC transporter ATP-binding protein [Lysinibacter sp. HNR]WGD36885.1 ABC transporter ATP-binding protein [Lysinibacter sp. HNR]